MPRVRPLFLKMTFFDFKLNAQTSVEATDPNFQSVGPVPGLRVRVPNVQTLDSWQFEVQV
jgi:hypothetical protein